MIETRAAYLRFPLSLSTSKGRHIYADLCREFDQLVRRVNELEAQVETDRPVLEAVEAEAKADQELWDHRRTLCPVDHEGERAWLARLASLEESLGRASDERRRAVQVRRKEHPWPCRSTAEAVLGAVSGSAMLRCGLLEGHGGNHEFHMEWRDA